MTLDIKELSVARRDGKLLLETLGFRLEHGQRAGLVGESGSGKSLCVQTIFGALPQGVHRMGGTVTAFGTSLDAPGKARDAIRGRRMAWVPQDPMQALHPFLSVADQLTLLPVLHLGETRRGAIERLAPLMERLHLPREASFLRRRPGSLSGGQRQRVALLAALSCAPDLLILDEPTTALDASVQAEYMRLLEDIHRERGMSWLWITHDLALSATMTDDLIVMHGGRIIESGPTTRILKHPVHPTTRRIVEAAKTLEDRICSGGTAHRMRAKPACDATP